MVQAYIISYYFHKQNTNTVLYYFGMTLYSIMDYYIAALLTCCYGDQIFMKIVMDKLSSGESGSMFPW